MDAPLDSSSTGTLGAVFLGILQGLTEFLPVSSSGHLVVFQQFVPVAGDAVLFDLLLHLGTLLPALWFYRADVRGVVRDAIDGEGPWLARPGIRLIALVGVASIPTALIGLTLEDVFEHLFHAPGVVAMAFAVTGAWLWATRGRDEGVRDLLTTPLWMALLLGLAQGVAITPGISRSGATIGAALLLGLKRDLAVKLSFLMSVPAIVGAALLRLRDHDSATLEALPMMAGTLAAAVSGYAALVLLVKLVRGGRFSSFSWYLWAMAALTGAYAWVGAP